MKYQNIFTLLSLFIFGLTSAFGQTMPEIRLSLNQAVQKADSNAFQMRIARHQSAAAKGQNLSAWSTFLPRVTFSEDFVRSDDPVNAFGLKLKQGVFSQQDFALSSLNKPDPFTNYTTSVQVEQPLFNLDGIFGKSAASLQAAAGARRVQRASQQIRFYIEKAYFGLILAKNSLKAIETSLKAAKEHQRNAQLAYEKGLISKADALAAQVRVAFLAEKRIQARNGVNKANEQLGLLLGMSNDVTIIPTDSLNAPDSLPTITNLESLVDRRPDIEAMRLYRRAAAKSVWMQRSGWVPRVNGLARYEWNADSPFRKDASNWTVGINVSWNLFSGLKRAGALKTAAARSSESAVRLQQMKAAGIRAARQALRSLKAARQRVQVAKTALAQAQESLRLTEARYKEGLEKTSDLLDREAAMTNMKIQLLKALYDYRISYREVLFQIGLNSANVPKS